MKKLLISFLVGSVLVGVGMGMLLLEISEYSLDEYRNDIKNSQESIYTETYRNGFDNLSEEQLTIQGYAGHYHYLNGNTEVVLDKTVTNGFEVDVHYKGKKPNINMYTYFEDTNGYTSYSYDSERSRNDMQSGGKNKISNVNLRINQYSFTPKDILDTASYICQNKTFLEDGSNYIVEKIVIRTSQPERIILDF